MSRPFFSIVTVNYNYGRFIEQSIRSVLDQSCQDFELIVVDGGSNDDSVEIIRRYADRLGWWCSEADKGQSDAFNKGFSHARGRFLTWLNADDVMFPGALERIKAGILRHAGCEWFTAGCFWLDPELRVIRCTHPRRFSPWRARHGEIPVWAPSSFFTKELYDRVGGVDVDFHYMMDTELWFRFNRQAGIKYQPIDAFCWGLRLHPNAKMSGHNFGTSEHSLKSHPKWQQMNREWEIFASRYGKEQPSRLVRWLTTPPWVVLRNNIDTARFKGRPYAECFT